MHRGRQDWLRGSATRQGKEQEMTNSEKLFQQAVQVMPGGVNSPVRAFGSVGATPRFIQKAAGAFLD